MHNPIDLSDYEDITVESDIQSLKQFLDELDNWENPTKYTVIEYFPPDNNPDYKPRIYEITNLHITDIEAGTIICNGYLESEEIMLFDNMIYNGTAYGLSIFLEDNIIMISINKNRVTISFSSGYIQIFY